MGILEDESHKLYCSSTTGDPENFIEELKKVFEVMHVVDIERAKLATYNLKGIARTWFDLWKES